PPTDALYRSVFGFPCYSHQEIRNAYGLTLILNAGYTLKFASGPSLPALWRSHAHKGQPPGQPPRCQPTTVAGVTTVIACFQTDQSLRVRTQKNSIDHSNLWSRMLALEHGQLLPENQVFQ